MPAPDPPTVAPLVATKLHAPRRRHGSVPRPRLGHPRAGPDRPTLTLVSAAAGFGKTTLLTEWFAAGEGDRSTAWLSLDERDNDPTTFLTYLIAAVETAAPGVGRGAASLLGSSPASREAIVATLVNDLTATGPELVVVLDDYHVIESTAVHEIMGSLLEHLPSRVRLVVATRADPPFPLARLRARGELLEVRAADLRFTTAEAVTYFSDAMGLELAADDVAALAVRTEGWITALQLAALSLRGRDDVAGFIAGFTGDDRFVVDYLAEEVLGRQPDEVRSFLLRTSVLGRLTGPLCDAVTGRADGTAMLEALDRANLFLVPLDDRRRWYRYHHLFGDVLRARLVGDRPELVDELHRRAGDWHEAAGDRAEAITHALAGGHVEQAARLIELAGPELRRSRQEVTLRGWLEALPADLLPDRPVLGIGLVGVRMATGETGGVEALVRDVERWLDPSDPDRAGRTPIVFAEDDWAQLPAQVAVQRAGLALLAGDVAATLAHAGRVLELVDPADHLRRGSAAALMGLAHWRLGDLDAARLRYTDAVGHLADAGFTADALGCSLGLADIQIEQGRLGEAARTLDAGLDLAREQPGLRGTADMHVGLAEIHLERDELDETARHLHASRALGEHAGLPQHAHRWRVAEARHLAARGDGHGALELLAEAQAVYDTDFSPALRPIPALIARVHLAHGGVEPAHRWARDSGLTTDDELDHLSEFAHLTLARVLLAQSVDGAGRAGATIAFLDRLRAAAEAGRRTGSLVEALVLLAVAHHRRGDRSATLAALEEALVRAAPEGHVRVFVDEGPVVVQLLHGPFGPAPAREHAARVLAGLRAETVTPPAHDPLVAGLSSREIDVLRLLRSELSGPAIARELLVSLNTLRTHTKNLYAKLGVHNRREAVRRATELGL